MPIAAARVSSPAKVSAPIFPAAEDQILIRKVPELGGWLSKMSPHPIEYEGQKWLGRLWMELRQELRSQN